MGVTSSVGEESEAAEEGRVLPAPFGLLRKEAGMQFLPPLLCLISRTNTSCLGIFQSEREVRNPAFLKVTLCFLESLTKVHAVPLLAHCPPQPRPACRSDPTPSQGSAGAPPVNNSPLLSLLNETRLWNQMCLRVSLTCSQIVL